MKKFIGLFLVLAIMAVGGYYLIRMEHAEDEKMRNLYTEVEPLEREREALESELAGLDTQYALKMRDYSTVEILFTTLDYQIFSEVYPIMRDHGVVGVLGLSYTEFPNFTNRLKAEEVARLCSDGWGTCIMYDTPWGNFPSQFESFCRNLDSYGIPAPTSIYFPETSSSAFYDSSMDEMLIECGITTVILPGPDGRSQTVTDVTGPLWFTYSMPWYYTGAPTDLELLGRTDGGNLCFTMKLNEIWDKTKNKNIESKEATSFLEIMDSWTKAGWVYDDDPLKDYETVGPTPYMYVDTNDKDQVHDVLQEMYKDALTPAQELLLPRFRSVNFDAARSYHLNAASDNVTLQAELEQERSKLESEIASLEAQIRSLYAQYNVAQKKDREEK
ncbi:MAG: hypothetical protein K6C12_14920 [Oscillospiraceae bacterium]|nr:hypothetical protein [Oscillospiraceae bacterium]